MTDEREEARVDALYDRLEGAYLYGGDGEWSRIDDVVRIDDCIQFNTTAVRYESVPHDLREHAYDAYDGEKTVCVGAEIDGVMERGSA